MQEVDGQHQCTEGCGWLLLPMLASQPSDLSVLDPDFDPEHRKIWAQVHKYSRGIPSCPAGSPVRYGTNAHSVMCKINAPGSDHWDNAAQNEPQHHGVQVSLLDMMDRL